MTDEIAFQVHGIPAPGGSKRGFYSPKLKRVIITEDCAKSRPWRALVSDAALQAHQGPPLEGPLRLEVEFVFMRPKNHTGKRGLKAWAPHFHTSAPDATKLLRSTEDALKGICWGDDAQVAQQSVTKRYGERPGAVVRVSRIGLAQERAGLPSARVENRAKGVGEGVGCGSGDCGARRARG